jgi:predicted PurR-regulated permease PerM
MVFANVLIFLTFSTSVTTVVTKLTNPAQITSTYLKLRGNIEKISPLPIDEETFPKDAEKAKEWLNDLAKQAAPGLLQQVGWYSANWAWLVILILFTTFFVMLEGKMLARRFVAIFGPGPEVQAGATKILFEVASQVRTYLVWRTIINLGLAVVIGVIFQIMGISQAWTWAILLAILNYIPYFGPVLASIPPFLDAFVSTEHPAVPILAMIIYWVVIVVEGWLVVPLLMGRNMDLNATTVMLACLFWPLVWGPTGLFLAMPIMAAIKAVLSSIPEWQPWADLMSSADDAAPPPPATSALPSTEGSIVSIIPPDNNASPTSKNGDLHGNPDVKSGEPAGDRPI